MTATTWGTSTGYSLSNGNLTATRLSSGAPNIANTLFRSTGKYYYEAVCSSVSPEYCYLGFVDPSYASGYIDAIWWGGTATNDLVIDNSNASGFANFGAGDVACLAIDFDNRNLWVRVNGGNWNNSGTANPASNAGGHSIGSWWASLTPAFYDTITGRLATANFGASPFSFTVPSGFSAWNPLLLRPPIAVNIW